VKHIDLEKECNTCSKPLILNYNYKDYRYRQKDYTCEDCYSELKKKEHKENMYVNGKYVPRSHALYKPGKYKSFEDAAFSSFEKYESSTEGEVYILTNPAWKGWFKVGMAVDSDDRCRGYQTSSPFRDYKVEYRKEFKDRRSAESTAHRRLKRICKKHEGEWFNININKVIEVIESI
tara:strand:+ start:2669 stop:3199 length:531 start_codon:yes stop_codon:yes gene_type:complete